MSKIQVFVYCSNLRWILNIKNILVNIGYCIQSINVIYSSKQRFAALVCLDTKSVVHNYKKR